MVAPFYSERHYTREKRQAVECTMDQHGHYCHDDCIASGMQRSTVPQPPRNSQHPEREEPIIEAIFDGFPGSTGYDDVRSINSSTYLHLPTSPAMSSSNGGWYCADLRSRSREQDELAQARRQTKAPIPTSYGPNPVTPTLTPRVKPAPVPEYVTSFSDKLCTHESTPSAPPSLRSHFSYGFGTYESSDYTTLPSRPVQSASKAKPPIVVSYGPNRVTPTPMIKSPTVPPDDAMLERHTKGQERPWQQQSQPQTPVYHPIPPPPSQPHIVPSQNEREYPWDDESNEQLRGLGLGNIPGNRTTISPLPPYASTADFHAMQQGAIRKVAEPEAQAELPPTKDGFYPFLTGSGPAEEFELPGSSVGASLSRHQAGPVVPSAAHLGAPPRRGGIDDQKFMLDDEDMRKLKARKMDARKMLARDEMQTR